MTRVASLFPHPLLSLMLLVLWLLLNNSFAPGHILLGAVLGVLIPMFSRRFWPRRLAVANPMTVLRFTGRVLVDIVVANFSVARVVLNPKTNLRPVFVKVPLEVESDFALTLLASVISLTPGTVSADLNREKRYLLVHALSSEDPLALVNDIKSRYEAPIKEMFP